MNDLSLESIFRLQKQVWHLGTILDLKYLKTQNLGLFKIN
jgi:hypothetical protein